MSFVSKKKNIKKENGVTLEKEPFPNYLIYHTSIGPIDPDDEAAYNFFIKNEDTILRQMAIQLVKNRHDINKLKQIVDWCFSHGMWPTLPGMPGQYFPKEIFVYIRKKWNEYWDKIEKQKNKS
ncbi:MAG: hypothetical protein Q6363_007985 [Candidatus Njordarchaeota archaeon]